MSDTEIPPQMPRRNRPRSQAFGRWLLSKLGWRLEGELPNEAKLMVIVAPHTSNWDFVVGMAAMLSVDLKISYLMKKEAFFWPFKNLFMDWGGIPLDRSQAQDVVSQAVEWYQQHDEVWIGITPEGTRSKVNSWKTGFMRIAQRAQVPVFLVGVDASRKTIVLDKVVAATENYEQQVEEIRQYMNDKFTGINPKNQ